jgi:hypothetical protein
MWPADVRFAAVTNPGGRRARLFADAVRSAGLPPVVEIPWRALAAGETPTVPAGALVRIDSPDGDAEVDRLLRGDAEPAAHGEIRPGAAWYAGFTAALGRLRGGRDLHEATLLSDPDEVAVMFDKPRCHAALDAAGVPVPAALPPVTGYCDLRERMRAAGFGRVFAKPPHGSSASGIIALETAGARLVATTSVEVADGSGGSRRPATAGGRSTCASWWWLGGPRTWWCGPVGTR